MNNASVSQYCDLYVNKEVVTCLGIELAQYLLLFLQWLLTQWAVALCDAKHCGCVFKEEMVFFHLLLQEQGYTFACSL